MNYSIKLKKMMCGQGMTEYIIIVALIAIAAIGVFGAYGNVTKGQVGAMAAELGGNNGSESANHAGQNATAANTRGQDKHSLSDFQDKASKAR
jgi:Flp pilus assembly pilin Flp